MKRVICLLVIGQKHKNFYNENKKSFEAYAKKTKATLKIFDSCLDTTNLRSIQVQKLLIPSAVLDFDIALFLDLDIIINKNCPDIFNELPQNKSFAAVIDNRSSEEFVKTWSIKNETVKDYFKARNFEYNENLSGSINGGVFLFKPQEVAILFKEYYFSNHNVNTPELGSYEEAPMAYLTQINKIFHALDPKYNTQVIYKIKGTKEGKNLMKNQDLIPEFIRKKINKNIIPSMEYTNFIDRLLENCWILHFAGGYPIPTKKKPLFQFASKIKKYFKHNKF